MKKVAAVGERHSFLSWRVAGCEFYEADSPRGLAIELARLARDTEVALVLVPEHLASEAGQALEDFRTVSAAVLMVLPDGASGVDAGYASVRRSVERALGVDILGDIE